MQRLLIDEWKQRLQLDGVLMWRQVNLKVPAQSVRVALMWGREGRRVVTVSSAYWQTPTGKWHPSDYRSWNLWFSFRLDEIMRHCRFLFCVFTCESCSFLVTAHCLHSARVSYVFMTLNHFTRNTLISVINDLIKMSAYVVCATLIMEEHWQHKYVMLITVFLLWEGYEVKQHINLSLS